MWKRCLVAAFLMLSLSSRGGTAAGQDLAELSDVDLGSAYLRAQPYKQSLLFSEAREEIQRRGSTKIAEAIYDGFVSSACPPDSFGSGYAKIIQDGAELSIRQESKSLQGVVIKDTVLLVIPPKKDLLVGNILEDRIDLIAASGACSMSFARAVDLHEAVRAGDVEAVRSVIASGADVNQSDSWGTALAIAVSKGSDKIAELLIDAGADVERPTSSTVGAEHPLHLAATRSSRVATARLLVSRGAKLDARDKSGRTPLITAIVADNIEVADVLLAAGADIDAVDSNLGATALSWAACFGRFKAVSFLLSKGAQINGKTGPDGDTPLHHAVVCCHKVPAMIEFLVKNGADVNATNNKGLAPIHQAFNQAEKDLLRSLGAKEQALLRPD
jgi:ankyrin repeat protein